MRRAMRHAHLLGSADPLMHRLVPALITEMGDAYPQLARARAALTTTFEQEEDRFRRTLGRGSALLDDATRDLKSGDSLDGETAFKLYDTYGFPLDLTQDALRTRGIDVDTVGFDTAMARQKEMAKAAGFKSGDAGTDEVWHEILAAHGGTEFTGYTDLSDTGTVQALIVDNHCVDQASDGPVIFVTNQTPFYAESGGQAGDKGIAVFDNGARVVITDVLKKAGDLHAHIGILTGTIAAGASVSLVVDADIRERTKRNHSATHIMHEALRRILGDHVIQKGQMVDEDRIRFDIAHGTAITRDELRCVEDEVNQIILQNAASETRHMAPEAAIEAGAMALFGEKYGDEVRVLSLGHALGAPSEDAGAQKGYSVELCGGTHVDRTGDIAVFKIISEGAVAAGIRRVEAVTGAAARHYLETQATIARESADRLKIKPEDVPARIDAMISERKKLEKDLASAKTQLALGGGGGGSAPEDINGIAYIGRLLDGVSGKDLRGILNEQIQSLGSGIVAMVAVDGGKVALAVAVTPDLTAQYSAATLVNLGAEKIGGRGGGKAEMAQAGGSDVSGAQAALDTIKGAIAE